MLSSRESVGIYILDEPTVPEVPEAEYECFILLFIFCYDFVFSFIHLLKTFTSTSIYFINFHVLRIRLWAQSIRLLKFVLYRGIYTGFGYLFFAFGKIFFGYFFLDLDIYLHL